METVFTWGRDRCRAWSHRVMTAALKHTIIPQTSSPYKHYIYVLAAPDGSFVLLASVLRRIRDPTLSNEVVSQNVSRKCTGANMLPALIHVYFFNWLVFCAHGMYNNRCIELDCLSLWDTQSTYEVWVDGRSIWRQNWRYWHSFH